MAWTCLKRALDAYLDFSARRMEAAVAALPEEGFLRLKITYPAQTKTPRRGCPARSLLQVAAWVLISPAPIHN